eukprot:1749403-Rhodomonas_salina.7
MSGRMLGIATWDAFAVLLGASFFILVALERFTFGLRACRARPMVFSGLPNALLFVYARFGLPNALLCAYALLLFGSPLSPLFTSTT